MTTTKLRRRKNSQHEQIKSHATSGNSKNRGIVKRRSINKTLLIKQRWVNSCDEITYEKTIGRRGAEKIGDNSLSQI